MNRLGITALLFTTIFLEGFVVLSAELLAIRQTIPYVGSGTDTISIIIAAVLMPLAFGYHAGGQFRPGYYNGRYISIRKRLIKNLITAQIILMIGLSTFTMEFFFKELLSQGIGNRWIMTGLYSMVFLVTPVYLLGQTIPLISNYFLKKELSRITGTMLFFSTVGSFLGSVFSTLVLMAFLGVHHTVSINIAILAILVTLLCKTYSDPKAMLAWGVLLFGMFLNSNLIMSMMSVVENNQYNTIKFININGDRHMVLNGNSSSKMGPTGKRHPYIEFIEEQAIIPIWKSNPPANILVIGAGGFTLGAPDQNNHYDFVDIDGALKDVAEKYILEEKLGENKHFHPMPARAFLNQTSKTYDLIVLDAYQGAMTLPEHLATQEFFRHAKSKLKPNGVLMANFIASPSFNNDFTRNIDNTFRSVFPHVSRHVMNHGYNLWSDEKINNGNVIYLYKNRPIENEKHIYTDDRNTVFLDKPTKHHLTKDADEGHDQD